MKYLILSLAFLGYLVTLSSAQTPADNIITASFQLTADTNVTADVASQYTLGSPVDSTVPATTGAGPSTVKWAAADQSLGVTDLTGAAASTPPNPPQQPGVGGTTPPLAGSPPGGTFNFFGGSGGSGGLGSLTGLFGNMFAASTTAVPPGVPAPTTPMPASSAGGSALNDLFGTPSGGLDAVVNSIISNTGSAASPLISAPNGTDQLLPGLSTNDFTRLIMNSPGSATTIGSGTNGAGAGVSGFLPPPVPGMGSVIDNSVVGTGSLPAMGTGFINNMVNMVPKPASTSMFGTPGSPTKMAGLPPVPPKRSNSIQDNPAMMFFLMSSLGGGEMPEGAELMLPLMLMNSQRKPQPPPQPNMNSLLSMMRNPTAMQSAGPLGPMGGPLASLGSPLSTFSSPLSGLFSGSSSNTSPSLMDSIFPAASGPGTSSSGSASPASGLGDLLGFGPAGSGSAVGASPTSSNTASILDSLLTSGGAGAGGSLVGR